MTMPGGGNSRQANVSVSADTTAYVKGINAANAATLQFANALKKIDDSVISITKKVGVAGMAVGGVGLLSAFGDVKSAAALESSFKSLSAQATQTGANVKQISSSVVSLGTQIPVATRNIALMASQISQLGITGTKNIMTVTKQAEQLAAATNTAPGQLMTGLIQMNQSLGGSLQDLERYGSALTAIQAKMGVASTDVMNFVGGIQAVGAKAGISTPQLLGLSAALVKVGADGSSGAQAFNQVVNQMTDAVSRNSPDVQKFADLLGISTEKFKGLITSGQGMQAFVGFIQAINSEGSKATQTLEQFGLDSVRLQRVFAAMTSGQADVASAISQTNSAVDQNVAMAQASAAAWKGLDDQFQRISNGATQVKETLGGPLLSALNPLTSGIADVTGAFGNLLKMLNDAPWPVGDTLSSLVTKTPAILLLGGAFLTATAAVSKFAGAWRMMTGATAINAFRGFKDGRVGNLPADMGSNGRAGSWLYRQFYNRGAANDGLIGINARNSVGSMIAGYPMMRAKQQLGMAWDTLKHPFNPDKRDPGKVDPLSGLGLAQSASKATQSTRQRLIDHLRSQDQVDEDGNATNAATLAARLERGFGPVGDSAEAAKRKRFDYVNRARLAAVDRQKDINRTLTAKQLREHLYATELGQYMDKNGTDEGFQATRWDRMGERQLHKVADDKVAHYVGNQAADQAGKVYDASLSKEETAKLANPFEKLATRVKEISTGLIESTGEATKAVFAKITGWYGEAVAKIKELANEAKVSMVEVKAFMEEGTVRQDVRPPVPSSGGPLSLFGMKPPVPASKGSGGDLEASWDAWVQGKGPRPQGEHPDPTARKMIAEHDDHISSMWADVGLQQPSARHEVTRAAEDAGSEADDVVSKLGELKDALGEGAEKAKESAEATDQSTQATRRIARSALPPVPGSTRALPSAESIGRAQAIGVMRNAPAIPAEGLAEGMGRGGSNAGLMSGSFYRVSSRASRIAGGAGDLAVAGAKAAGQGVKAVGSAVGGLLGGVKTLATGLFSPQFMIAATLLGPIMYNLVNKLSEAHRKLSSEMDYAGAAVQRALGQQVTTQQDLIKQQQQSNTVDTSQDAYGSNEQNNAKSATFADNYKSQISSLTALGAGSKNESGDQVKATKSWMQNYVNGTVTGQNGGKPLNQQQIQQLRELAYKATGSVAGAQEILDGVDMTGQTKTNFITDIAGSYAKNGDDALRASLSTTAVQAVNANTGGGIATLLAAAGTVADQTGGNTFKQPRGKALPGSGIGNAKTGDLLKQFVNDYNQSHPDSKIDLPDGVDSVGEFVNNVKFQAEQAHNSNYQALDDQINSLGLHLGPHGELSAEDLGKLSGLSTAVGGSTNKQVGSDLEGTTLNQVYRDKVAHDPKGFVTDLLDNPNAVDFNQKIGQLQGAFNPGGIFSPDAVKNLEAFSSALQQVKDKLSPNTDAWKQLDALQKTNLANLQVAATMGGGQAYQLGVSSDMLSQAASGGVTAQNYTDIASARDATQQQAQQAIQTLNQYHTQVRDFYIQQERESQDHNTQMTRMQRDYNRQVDEANYEYGIQQREANYNKKLQDDQALYQFNEQLRLQKYQIAQSFGSPTSMVQAQFTQGADSALLGLKKQTADLGKSKSAMDQMAGMGVSSDVIRTLGLDDPKNFEQAQRYLKDFISNPSLIKSFNDEIASNLNIGAAISSDPNNSQFAEMKKQFDYTADQASKAFQHAADLSVESFGHSMDQNKKQLDISMTDFEQDYEKSTARAMQDLARLGEDTTMSWQKLIDWAQKSGIPGVKTLGDVASTAISQVAAATAQLNGILAGLPAAFASALPQITAGAHALSDGISSAWNGVLGIFGGGVHTGGGGGAAARQGLNGVSINYSGGDAGVKQGEIVGAAESWLGTDYQWGGEGLNGQGVDCSGLVIAAYRAAGIPFSGRPVASTLGKMGKAVSIADAMPGDVVYYDEPGPVDHVGIYLGSNRMIDAPTEGKKVEVTEIGRPTSIRRMFATGAVFDGRSDITVGEAGPEVVLPLNSHGAQFMAQTMRASLQTMGMNPNLANEVRRGRVAQGVPCQAASNMSYHHTDASTNFNGEITVVAQDPNAMLKALQAKKRQQALTRPMARR